MPPLPPDAPSRFDLLLLFIAASVAGGVAVSLLSSLSLLVGGTAGSLVASVAMLDGLVRNPPV